MAYRKRAVRIEPAAPGNADVLRALSSGPLLTREELEQTTWANHDRYGFWGVSVSVAIDAGIRHQLLADRLARFEWVARFSAEDLRSGGVTLLPTGARPHHDLVTLTLSANPDRNETGSGRPGGPGPSSAAQCA